MSPLPGVPAGRAMSPQGLECSVWMESRVQGPGPPASRSTLCWSTSRCDSSAPGMCLQSHDPTACRTHTSMGNSLTLATGRTMLPTLQPPRMQDAGREVKHQLAGPDGQGHRWAPPEPGRPHRHTGLCPHTPGRRPSDLSVFSADRRVHSHASSCANVRW